MSCSCPLYVLAQQEIVRGPSSASSCTALTSLLGWNLCSRGELDCKINSSALDSAFNCILLSPIRPLADSMNADFQAMSTLQNLTPIKTPSIERSQLNSEENKNPLRMNPIDLNDLRSSTAPNPIRRATSLHSSHSTSRQSLGSERGGTTQHRLPVGRTSVRVITGEPVNSGRRSIENTSAASLRTSITASSHATTYNSSGGSDVYRRARLAERQSTGLPDPADRRKTRRRALRLLHKLPCFSS